MCMHVCMSETVYSLACLSVLCKNLNVMGTNLNLIRFVIMKEMKPHLFIMATYMQPLHACI